MIERGHANEDEMIATFLLAEAAPPSHWNDDVKKGLVEIGADLSLIENPNLKDPAENLSRKKLLDSYRGYARRQGQFDGFPAEVKWRKVDLEPQDFQAIQYMNHQNWNELSSGERFVYDGARNLPGFASDQRFQHIVATGQAIRAERELLPLIAAQRDGGRLVLIEGHSRATAYAFVGFKGLVKAFVGSSPSMDKWKHY